MSDTSLASAVSQVLPQSWFGYILSGFFLLLSYVFKTEKNNFEKKFAVTENQIANIREEIKERTISDNIFKIDIARDYITREELNNSIATLAAAMIRVEQKIDAYAGRRSTD